MKQKILFFDVDGTIVTSDHRIPPSAVEALSLAKQAGHITVVNTGRPFNHVEPQIKALPFSGFVCSCGGHIICDGKILYHNGFSHSESSYIRSVGKEIGLTMLFESEHGVSLDSSFYVPYPEHEIKRMREFGVQLLENIDADDFAFDKVCCWGAEGEKKEVLISELGARLDFIEREHGMLECVPKGQSKANGMEKMMCLLGFSPEDSFAFGDSNNDYPMMQMAGKSIAMGNAPDSLKASSDYVTDDVECDGLFNAMKHLDLLG